MYWRSTAAPAGVLASSMGGISAAGRIEARAWGFITQRRYRNATGPAPPPPTLIRFMTRVPARAVTAIMGESRRAWRKMSEKNLGMPESNGMEKWRPPIYPRFGGLSTFVILGQVERSEGCEPRMTKWKEATALPRRYGTGPGMTVR
jgi:hypothetical protein